MGMLRGGGGERGYSSQPMTDLEVHWTADQDAVELLIATKQLILARFLTETYKVGNSNQLVELVDEGTRRTASRL
ncbi:unnamed protein product [Protopolystoma xenopodis]|uniref:Uncharacterized protein n=1 Tax=Protopolystoma xenopodis TaxID=117903 RepID=A0A448WI69_9PLAT|nr:unnamed protein product [Protopolystoma xenopodis]